ncbi:hypothetical protein P9112_012846 [Eukaryota sp. TZLM1-RC]
MFEETTQRLQKADLSLLDAKLAFDFHQLSLSVMTNHLSYPSPIMHSSQFECAVVRILSLEKPSLTAEKKAKAHHLLLVKQQDVIVEEQEPVSLVFEAFRKAHDLQLSSRFRSSCFRYSFHPHLMHVKNCLV